jgi:hypothetical protein
VEAMEFSFERTPYRESWWLYAFNYDTLKHWQ